MPGGFGARGGRGPGRGGSGRGDSTRPKRSARSILRAFWPFIRPYRWAIIFGTSCVLFSLILEKTRPLLYKYLVDSALTPILEQGWSETLYREGLKKGLIVILGMFALAGFGALTARVHMFVMHRAGAAMVMRLRTKLYDHLQGLSLSFFETRQTGEIMSRLTGDVDGMERLVTHISDQIVNTIFNILLTLIILFVLSWKLALVALIPVPILLFVVLRFARHVRPVYRAIRDFFGGVTARLQDNIAGIRVIKAFHTEAAESKRFAEQNQEYFDRQVSAMRMWTKTFPTVHFIQATGNILVTGVGAYLLLQSDRGGVTLGDLFAFNAYVIQLYQPINALVRMYDWVLRSLASGERILEVLETESDIADSPDAHELPPIDGEVTFDHVYFRYATGDMVLNDVSVTAKPGQTVALVGRSGAGKTSMVNLIPRFFDPVSGRVMIDGHDVREVTRESLRRQVSIVLQDPFLFNGTVAENIRYARPDASDEELRKAAEAAYAHGFIEELPSSYDTEIGERGIKLSGGQKQRLAIARALLADRRILILDEATAMVDSQAEYEIQQALRRLMQNRTTFVIAHRLSTVKNAHQIVTLEGGEVVERGDHKTLIAQNGTYAQMYQAQFRLALEDEDW